MGFWTQATGTINGEFAMVVTEDKASKYISDVIGKELVWDETRDSDEQIAEWEYAFEHPELYLPLGSEGSLRYKCTYDSHTGAYQIDIFGSLRDEIYTRRVIKWFIDLCCEFNPKKAKIRVSSDGWELSKYEHESKSGKTLIKEVKK